MYKNGTIDASLVGSCSSSAPHIQYSTKIFTSSSPSAKMANPALSTSVPLGQWVDTLLNLIFFQPDDALSASTYEQYVSSDFAVR